jgi:hypothetical protein
MDINLSQILALVGKLNDSIGEDTAQTRFRNFLKENINEIAQIRDYVEECVRNKGDLYNKALQDLIIYIGEFLNFEIEYGRYKGISGEIGYDGIWTSINKDFKIVLEVKTSEVYPIKISTLVGYIDNLISERKISNWDNTLGLYVVAQPDTEIRQLERNIIIERRTDKIRVISSDLLLSLAEFMREYDINHDDILAVLYPSGPRIDPIIDILTRLVTQPPEPITTLEGREGEIKKKEVVYWLTPIKAREDETFEEAFERLLVKNKIYAFGERTPGRNEIKLGDKICFYASGKGVMAYATVASNPIKKLHNAIKEPEKYPWIFQLKEPKIDFGNPIVINANIRSKLDAFKDKDPNTTIWSWFVQSTKKITENDFKILTSLEN